MKKIALLLLLAASFSMPAFAADGAEPIKLISYNLRTSHGKDGDNVWMKRRHATPEMIRREAPDVFGVQEGLIDQLHYIDTECPQYALSLIHISMLAATTVRVMPNCDAVTGSSRTSAIARGSS